MRISSALPVRQDPEKVRLVNELAKVLYAAGKRIAIIAVDPSSPFTGGALLGDRVRMQDLSGLEGVYIRSMASRGSLGGLSRAVGAVIKVLDAAGFECILIETVGAGQAEVDIASTAHTAIVIEAPGMGDEVQSIKAGILEIADILVVNKADKPGAARTVKALEMMIHMGQPYVTNHHGRLMAEPALNDSSPPRGWDVPVLETVAFQGQGIAELAQRITAHHDYLKSSGVWLERENERSRKELEQLIQQRFLARVIDTYSKEEREQYVTAVARRELDPYTAVERLFQQLDRQKTA